MKLHEIAAQVVDECSCKMVFPTKDAGEYATKRSAYVFDKYDGLRAAAQNEGLGRKLPRSPKAFTLDLFSASIFVQVRNALSEANRTKLDGLAATDPVKAVLLALKCSMPDKKANPS